MFGLNKRILAILLCACEAEGDALSYEWHFRNKNITEFSKSSTVTLTMCIFITDITIDGECGTGVRFYTGCEIGREFTGILDELEIQPANATNKQLKWTSSDPEIASIDETTGVLTCKKFGQGAILAATTDGSGLQAGGELEVVPEAVSELTLSVKDNTITASCRIAPTEIISATESSTAPPAPSPASVRTPNTTLKSTAAKTYPASAPCSANQSALTTGLSALPDRPSAPSRPGRSLFLFNSG